MGIHLTSIGFCTLIFIAILHYTSHFILLIFCKTPERYIYTVHTHAKRKVALEAEMCALGSGQYCKESFGQSINYGRKGIHRLLALCYITNLYVYVTLDGRARN